MPSDQLFIEFADKLADIQYALYLNKGDPEARKTLAAEWAVTWANADKWAQEKTIEPRAELMLLLLGAQVRFQQKFKGRKRDMKDSDLRQTAEEYIEFLWDWTMAKTKEEYDSFDYRSQDLTTKVMKMTMKSREKFFGYLMEIAEKHPGPYYFKQHIRQYAALFTLLKIRKPLSQIVGLEERRRLAEEIVTLIEPQLKETVGKAVADALAWREKPVLQKVKEAIGKERVALKGRESCIFLEVGNENLMLS